MLEPSILWKLTSKDNPNSSYLLGTIHIQTRFAFAGLATFKELIDRCDAYAGESNLDDLAQAQLEGQFDPAYAQRYQQILSDNQWRHLDRFIRKEIPQIYDMWTFFHPMLLMSQIESALMGTDEPQSLDLTIWEYAKGQGKQMLAIEPASMQHDIFKDIDLETSFRSVRSAISSLPRLRKKYQKLSGYYQNQDIQSLYLRTKKQLGKMKHTMLYDRNVFMAEQIALLIRQNPTFIGIGVGHLPGQKGVLRLLKHKGIRLEAVRW